IGSSVEDASFQICSEYSVAMNLKSSSLISSVTLRPAYRSSAFVITTGAENGLLGNMNPVVSKYQVKTDRVVRNRAMQSLVTSPTDCRVQVTCSGLGNSENIESIDGLSRALNSSPSVSETS